MYICIFTLHMFIIVIYIYMYINPERFINFNPPKKSILFLKAPDLSNKSPSSNPKELTAARLALSSFTGASQWLSEEPTEVSGETSVLLKCHGCRMGCRLDRCHRFQNWLICLFIYTYVPGSFKKKSSMSKWSRTCSLTVRFRACNLGLLDVWVIVLLFGRQSLRPRMWEFKCYIDGRDAKFLGPEGKRKKTNSSMLCVACESPDS